MNILVCAYKFGTEKEIGEHLGTYHYFIEKMRRLVKMGHSITVLCPYLSFTHKGSEDVSGVRVVRYLPTLVNIFWLWPLTRLVRWLYIYQTQKKALEELSKKKYDFLYVWQARETGYAIARIKEKLGVPFYFRQITAWQWHFQRKAKDVFGKRQWYQKFARLGLARVLDIALNFLLDAKTQMRYAQTIYEKADKIIFLSRAAIKEGTAMGLEASRAYDLGVGIEEDMFRPLSDTAGLRRRLGIDAENVILFIGRIIFEEKGVGYLLEAMKLVHVRFARARLVIVGGGGEEERMSEAIQRLGISEVCIAAGKKPFSELPLYINASDVLAVPSVWMEAFGQVTIEAMSCGVPVVTSDAGASPEINIDGETGFVVPAKSSEKLAEAIIKILENPELQKSMGLKARQRVREHYTYEALIKKFFQIVSK